jgi:hypothetical protein
MADVARFLTTTAAIVTEARFRAVTARVRGTVVQGGDARQAVR